jgi:predicted GNAT family N-acyltransferase
MKNSKNTKGIIRKARPDETQMLSDLALESKAYWGYEQTLLEACRKQLTLTKDYIRKNEVYVFEQDKAVLGFYSLIFKSSSAELGYMFVSPKAIGLGIGRSLMQHAFTIAHQHKSKELIIQSDPHAEGFYIAMGAIRIGESPSDSIPGRMLPLLRVVL